MARKPGEFPTSASVEFYAEAGLDYETLMEMSEELKPDVVLFAPAPINWSCARLPVNVRGELDFLEAFGGPVDLATGDDDDGAFIVPGLTLYRVTWTWLLENLGKGRND